MSLSMPRRQLRRLVGLARLLLLVAFEAAAIRALLWAGTVPRWRVPWESPGRWLDQAPPADIVVGLGRYVALGIAVYLAATTVAYLLASFTRSAALIRWTGALTLPGVRSVVQRAALTAMVAGPALAPAAAFAHEQRPAVVWQAPGSTAPALSTQPADSGEAAGVVGTVAVAPSLELVGSWPVAPGDNLFVIAEATVAHAQGVDVLDVRMADVVPYWLELCEVATAEMRSGDPNLIFPDEIAKLPAYRPAAPVVDVTPAPPPVVAPAPAAVPAPPVTAPAPQTAVEPQIPAPAATVAPTAPAATTPATAPAATVLASDSADVAEEAPVPTTAGEKTETPAKTTAGAGSRATVPTTTLVGGGLLAAGLVGAVGRMRANRARNRTPGTSAPLPSPETAEVEQAVLVAADTGGARFLTAGLRALGAVAARLEPGELAPLGVIAGDDGLEIIMGGQVVMGPDGHQVTEAPTARPGPPFAGTPSRWLLERPDPDGLVDLEALGEGVPVPVPALVSLGKNGEGAEVLIDLEDAGMVTVTGDGALDVVTAAAFALACPPWDEIVAVLCVGFASPPVGSSVRAVSMLDAATCADLERQAQECAILLEATGSPVLPPYGSTLEARIAGVAEETWVPTVVVCAAPPSPALAARLVGMVNDPAAHGIAVLVAGRVVGAPCELEIRPDDGLLVDFLDTRVVEVNGVSLTGARGMRGMLEGATAAPVYRPAPTVAPGTPEILVRVLGPIEVTGPDGPLVYTQGKEAKAREAIVYLACHGEEVSGATLKRALWGEAGAAHFSQIMHASRQAIGVAHLPTNTGSASRYATGPGVVTDVALCESALASRDPEALRSALARVRGGPFTTTGRGYEWATAEGLAGRAAEIVADAACCLVDLALEAGDTGTARWAAEQGLLASPGHEATLRHLMKAEAADGDRAGVEAAYGRIVESAEAVGAEPSAVSAALRDELLAKFDKPRAVVAA